MNQVSKVFFKLHQVAGIHHNNPKNNYNREPLEIKSKFHPIEKWINSCDKQTIHRPDLINVVPTCRLPGPKPEKQSSIIKDNL